jgi:hypothetical protein
LLGVQGTLFWGDLAMASNTANFANRWRALAKEALEVADEMTDPEAEEQMWKIALSYERLARHAETCQALHTHHVPPKQAPTEPL